MNIVPTERILEELTENGALELVELLTFLLESVTKAEVLWGQILNQTRYCASAVVRSEVGLLGLSTPRFHFRFTFDIGKSKFLITARRKRTLDRHLNDVFTRSKVKRSRNLTSEQRHPDILDEYTQTEHPRLQVLNGDCVADCLLGRPPFLPLELYRLNEVKLLREYGECIEPYIEDEDIPKTSPYVRTSSIGGGLCAQACAYIATVILHKHASRLCGLAEITALAASDKRLELLISGLDERELAHYFETVGLRGVYQFVNPERLWRPPQNRIQPSVPFDLTLESYALSGMPMLLMVDVNRFNQIVISNKMTRGVISPKLAAEMRGSKELVPEEVAFHTVVVIGCSIGEGTRKYVMHDTSSLPFLIASADELSTVGIFPSEAGHWPEGADPKSHFPTMMPVTPARVRMPLACFGFSEVSLLSPGLVIDRQAFQSSLLGGRTPIARALEKVLSPEENAQVAALVGQTDIAKSALHELLGILNRAMEAGPLWPNDRVLIASATRYTRNLIVNFEEGKVTSPLKANSALLREQSGIGLSSVHSTWMPGLIEISDLLPVCLTCDPQSRQFLLFRVRAVNPLLALVCFQDSELQRQAAELLKEKSFTAWCSEIVGLSDDHWIWLECFAPGFIRIWDAELSPTDFESDPAEPTHYLCGELRTVDGQLCLTPAKRIGNLRYSLITSFDVEPPTGQHPWPGDVSGVEFYACMSQQLKTLLPAHALGPTGELNMPCESFASAYDQPRNERGPAVEFAEAILALHPNSTLVGFATFFPEILSFDRSVAASAEKALLFLIEVASTLMKHDSKRINKPFIIQLVAGSRIHGIWVPKVRDTPSGAVSYAVNRLNLKDGINLLFERLRPIARLAAERRNIQLAIELEPGPLYLINDANAVALFCELLDQEARDKSCLSQVLGLNFDLPHWAFLANIPLDWLLGKCSFQGLSAEMGLAVRRRIIHAHSSDHGVGHFSDNPAGTHHDRRSTVPWFRFLNVRISDFYEGLKGRRV
jgi:hypothetical protein